MLQNHSIIRTTVIVIMTVFSFSLFSQCNVIVSNIIHPSNCNSSNGGFRVIAENPTPNCKRKIHVIKDNILLFSGEDNLTVSNLPAGNYLVIGESGCGCPVNHSQVVTLNGGTPTVLIPRVITGNIPMEAREVTICRGGSIAIGVQPLGTSNLVLVSPNGQTDNTPDGSSFWNLSNLQPQNAGSYTIKYTNGQGCTSQTTIMVRVSTFNVDVHQPQIVCQGQTVSLTANAFNAAHCVKSCAPTQDSLIVRWTLDQCNALNQTQQNSYAEFVPTIFKRQCTDVTASTVYRNAGEHSCTPVVNSYVGDVGMCFMAMDGCDLANYNANNALRFNVTLKPSQVGGLSKLSFREQSPLNWVTTNGSTGINNYNTKYLIRIYKDGLLVFQDNNKTTERTWNEEVFNFSGNPLFSIDTTTTFSFELFGYCSVPSGGNMSGWEVDDIKVFGSCCIATPSDTSIKYAWSTGDTTKTITFNSLGTSFYKVTATDCNGCISVDSAKITVIPNPIASINGKTVICQGDTTTLTAAGGSKYLWSNGSTSSSIRVHSAGVFTVTVTDGSNCTAEKSVTTSIAPNPIVTITGDTEICSGDTTTFTASGGVSFIWSTGATTSSILANAELGYQVTVTDANGCKGTNAVQLLFNPNASPLISGDLSICNGESTLLTASGEVSYAWSTGATSSTIMVSPVATTNYTVTATSADGCIGTASATVVVNQNPQGVITGDINICAGESTTLTVTDGASYSWSNGLTGDAITVSPSVNTLYTVTVTSNAGCTSTAWETVVVNPLPIAAIAGTTEICPNTSTTLTASGGGSYAWSTGATTNTIEVNTAGTYTVSVTSNAGCISSASTTVTVNNSPNVVISGDTNLCEGETSTLTISGNGTYLWSTGATTASISVNMSGNYSCTVTNQGGCTSTANVNVVVNLNPVASITGNNAICQGESTILNGQGGSSYLWSTGSTNTALIVSAQGVYTLTVTDAAGCTDSASFAVSVNPRPTVNINGQNLVCIGGSTQLTASGASSYLWTTSATTDKIIVTSSATYIVTGTDANGCTSTASTTVQFVAPPDATVTGDLNICVGDSTLLTASIGASYFWNTGATTSSIYAKETGIYQVIVLSAPGCGDTVDVQVNVYPYTVARILADTSVCTGTNVFLTGTGGGTYLWSTGETTATISKIATNSQTYSLTVTNAGDCSSVASVNINTKPLPTIDVSGFDELCQGQSTILIANGFSNSDCPGECVVDSSLLIKWTLDSCMADLISGSNAIYQEFKGFVSDTVCMPVYADTIYRLNGEIHSCTQGINGSVAMCIGTQDVCDPRKLDFTKALKIGFSINPSQVGQITHLSFYERSPLQYSWINGATGINNFVDKYAIRISKNGKFVYQQYDIASSRNWLKKSFDFTNIPNFKTQDSAYYLVEIVPYCRVNNGSDISVWDIDQVEVFGGCCEGNTNDVTSYVWSNGNTGSSINVTPTNNTIYTVTATDCCGCKATKDVRVLISNLQLDAGENKTITLGQQALITPSVQSLSGCFEIELKFRWSNGATTKNISVSPTSNTTYYLSVEDCHGCVYEDSISVNVTSNKLVTFPNPARDQITVVGPVVENSLLKIRLLRMDGQLILKRNIDIVQNDAINFELDLPDSLTSGAYILEVDNGFNVDRSIIVVQK